MLVDMVQPQVARVASALTTLGHPRRMDVAAWMIRSSCRWKRRPASEGAAESAALGFHAWAAEFRRRAAVLEEEPNACFKTSPAFPGAAALVAAVLGTPGCSYSIRPSASTDCSSSMEVPASVEASSSPLELSASVEASSSRVAFAARQRRPEAGRLEALLRLVVQSRTDGGSDEGRPRDVASRSSPKTSINVFFTTTAHGSAPKTVSGSAVFPTSAISAAGAAGGIEAVRRSKTRES
mmetsp:Transcript_90999/g.284660  ORF Transcript_90999/g.284660 Transcript_90999/m.284660 type:complete len:238 (+) Transcript_90999:370-1083(+)